MNTTGTDQSVNYEVFGQLEIAVRRRLEGLLHGDYQGLLPGHGSEMGEARSYRAGDDVRRIDWAVTARTGKPHVRDTIADHELTTLGVVDLSGSMTFGTGRRQKRDVAIEILGALGFVTAHGANRFGVLALHPEGEKWIPPGAGRHHVHSALRQLSRLPRSNAVDGPATIDLATGISRLSKITRRRGLAVVISDFLFRKNQPVKSDWSRQLRALSERHDVIAIEIRDPRELSLPDVGFLTVADPETGRRRVVDTSDKKLRGRYETTAMERREAVAEAIRSTGADHLVVRTDTDWLGDLIRHVQIRRKASAWRTGQ